MAFFLELQAKHNQEIAEFQRMAQTGMADLRRKQEAELDAAIQQERTDNEQHHNHQKGNSYNAVPPPAALTSEELASDAQAMSEAAPKRRGGGATVTGDPVPTAQHERAPGATGLAGADTTRPPRVPPRGTLTWTHADGSTSVAEYTIGDPVQTGHRN